jgi:hypothetical protein
MKGQALWMIWCFCLGGIMLLFPQFFYKKSMLDEAGIARNRKLWRRTGIIFLFISFVYLIAGWWKR